MNEDQQKLQNMNRRFARKRWGVTLAESLDMLDEISCEYGLSARRGELTFIGQTWYITHAGLLRVAADKGCAGIDTHCVAELSNPARSRWTFKALAYKSPSCRGFAGYGDAHPGNVSAQVYGAEMRVAETRAVNRALRKAYAIGLCSFEEIGSSGRVSPRMGMALRIEAMSKPARMAIYATAC